VEDRAGRLEHAEGGTLFLDEIGDLPLALQVKLLRVLENREYQPLGARKPRKADVRFVAATHRDLEEMVADGTFRRDLFFRINVVNLKIPPLRERPEDIPLLLDVALDRFNRAYGKRIGGFSPEALDFLLNHDYSGNVRELFNLVERAVILCRDTTIGAESMPVRRERVQNSNDAVLIGRRPTVEQLQELLRRHRGNKTAVARELGINRTTLWRWLKEDSA
jgi:transcriptional regulator with PAS, ATPase and Fis domain